jgi:hypothetical protein
MKALRKDRARRYASAESLAADVRRYLEGKPLEAAPESRVYLLRKFVRRNRLQVLAASAVAASLVGGFVATGLALDRALTAEQGLRAQLAETERAQEAERERAEQLKKVVQSHGDKPVPIVCERPGFAGAGGGVQLFVQDNLIRFEINGEALKKQGVRASPQFLKLSRKGPA